MSEGIRLTGLRVRGFHGVFDFEKREGQDFLVDLHVRDDTGAAQRSDALADTVDYGALAERAAAIVAGPPFDLIEALAAAIAEDLLAECADVEVTVHKPQAPIERAFADVSVTVRRTRPGVRQERPGGTAVLSLGSNVGDSAGALAAALTALDRHPRLRVLARSGTYASAPQGGVEQPDFLNAAALVDADVSARELLRICQGIELALGRTREVRWGPRTLDIDLIRFAPRAAGDSGPTAEPGSGVDAPAVELASADPELILPHPRAHERAFVLVPWLELRPGAVLAVPGRGPVPAAVLAAELADQGVRRLGGPADAQEAAGGTAGGRAGGRADESAEDRAGDRADASAKGRADASAAGPAAGAGAESRADASAGEESGAGT